MKTVVVIPALDEGDNVGDVVTGLLAEGVEAVVVADNGSTDDTADRARAAGATVVSEPRRGYGYACAAGGRAALELGAETLVYIDADHSSRPDELHRLIDPIDADDADLVLGSRVLGTISDGAMGPHQRFGNWLAARLMNRLYDLTVTDLGPYRAIRAELLEELDMAEMTFGWPTEMTVKCANRQARIIEVPVAWDQRRSGSSKVSGTVRGSVLAARYILGVTIKYSGMRPSIPSLLTRRKARR